MELMTYPELKQNREKTEAARYEIKKQLSEGIEKTIYGICKILLMDFTQGSKNMIYSETWEIAERIIKLAETQGFVEKQRG